MPTMKRMTSLLPALLLLLVNLTPLASQVPRPDSLMPDEEACESLYLDAAGPVRLVQPLVDAANSRWFFFSSACRPFGMVNLSPDMAIDGAWNSGYRYNEDTILFFSHIHAWQMSGIPVLPVTGTFNGPAGPKAYGSDYSHR